GPRGGRDGGRGGGGRRGGGGGRPGGGGPRGGGGGASGASSDRANAPAFDPTQQGAARFGYLALPEPVIAADADFNRGVSEIEFRQAASRRFALLDADHDGAITRGELPRLANYRQPRQGGKPKPERDDG
ncbi:EF-hand domain-containing protein, partial [Sphingomonas bacterium]|uniref:EF-hand domain-containing protein n=1 Tax=Sphingomonas bacterium TaxID=1895847 RepID=UPI001C2D9EEC